MDEERKTILIIDDNPDDIHMLMENLKSEYAVLAATSGEKGLAIAAKEKKPDLILMDVVMPVMDGYETCRRIKDEWETADIDVIFISAHDSVEEKLAGYDAGGSDYVIKPFSPDELMKKVQVSLKNK